jgi:hypothetical protein
LLASDRKYWHPSPVLFTRSLLLLAAALMVGCASKAKREVLDPERANSRAVEQRRMNTALETPEEHEAAIAADVERRRERVKSQFADQGVTERGAEIAAVDPRKAFDTRALNFGKAGSVGSKVANANSFQYVDRVRTKDFNSRSYSAKTAWMGDVKFGTKAAPQTKESWFARLTSRTRKYETRESADSNKVVASRPLPGSDLAYTRKGRKQALFDTNGPGAQAMGDFNGGQSWSGDPVVKTLTIDDVKKLLNKN